MPTLPMCDDLFQRFFDPWYDDAGRKRRPFKGTFPDILQHESLIGYSQDQVSRIHPQVQQKVLGQIARMVDAARGDMKTYLKVEGDIDLSWINAFDRYADRLQIQNLIARSDPKKLTNGCGVPLWAVLGRFAK